MFHPFSINEWKRILVGDIVSSLENYKLIIANALEIEEKISEEPNTAIMNREIDVTQIEEIKKKFEKSDTILTQEIPNTIAEISNSSELKDLSLTDKATLYYNEKINK